jgi:hypothetical protein
VPESTDEPEKTEESFELDAIADELYALPPDEFVPARDDRVAAAKEAGDRELARAVGRLRRPTRAAWLANLLARHRTEQLDGLVALSRGLAQAQHDLDGATLRALSGQRHRVVAAMARDAGRLAARRGEPVTDALVREVAGILDAALADPAIAEEVRAGRLTKTVRYSGFGAPADAGDGDDMAAWAASAPARTGRSRPPAADTTDTDTTTDSTIAGEPADAETAADRRRAERERAERERAAKERAERERALAEAEAEEAAARERQEADEAARDRADERHSAARSRVAELVAALEAARAEEQAALEETRAAASAARASARDAAAAAVRTARARARLEQLPS